MTLLLFGHPCPNPLTLRFHPFTSTHPELSFAEFDALMQNCNGGKTATRHRPHGTDRAAPAPAAPVERGLVAPHRLIGAPGHRILARTTPPGFGPRRKRPRDRNQFAKLIVGIVEDRRILVAGRAGGLKGGKARAATLSAERRKAIAAVALKKRWGA